MIAAWLLVFGCAHDAKRARSELSVALQRADTAWAAARDEEAVTAAVALYEQARSLAPDRPRVLARLVRAYAARGLAFVGDRSDDDLATARETGIRCLLSSPAYAGRTGAAPARGDPDALFSERALAVLGGDEVECLTWTGYAWSRWLEQRGAGAAIDWAPLQALARRAVEIDPRYDRGLPEAVLGLALALDPSSDRAEVEAHLARAMAADPARLGPKVDHALHVLTGEAQRAALTEVAAATIGSTDPERIFAEVDQARARAALAGLSP